MSTGKMKESPKKQARSAKPATITVAEHVAARFPKPPMDASEIKDIEAAHSALAGTLNTRMPKSIEDEIAKGKEAFLMAIQSGLSVWAGCRAARVPRTTIYRWQKADAAFAASWQEAWANRKDVIRDAAFRRGVLGVERPVFQGGKQVGTVREYSDNMLALLLSKIGVEDDVDGQGQDAGALDAKAGLLHKLLSITDTKTIEGNAT